jgi:DNA-binding PadR family transcriptional regulator
MKIDKDLVAASATPLVLGILAEGESYGYAILKRVNDLSTGRMTWTDGMLYPLLHRLEVNDLSTGRMTWTDGMLYPLLHRLERLGYVEAAWQVAPSGRRRRHYAITPSGVRSLAERQRQWEVVNGALDRVWRQAAAGLGGAAPATGTGG